MNKWFVALFVLVACSAHIFAQRSDADCAHLTFFPDTVNYGNVPQYAHSFYTVKYKNTGRCPVIIHTVIGLPVHTIAITKFFLFPGDSGQANLFYPTDSIGAFFKTVMLYSNAYGVFYLKGNVVHDTVCARLQFAADTLNLGHVPYVFGKHFIIKLYNSGTCPLVVHASIASNDYFEVTEYTNEPVVPSDSSGIGIHIGGPATGHYYGLLTVTSPNAVPSEKTLFIKATLMPPATIVNPSYTQIKVTRDLVNVGHTSAKCITAEYTITNTGHKPLVFKQPSSSSEDTIILPTEPVMPEKSCSIRVIFHLTSASIQAGAFIQYANLSGNFNGNTMPLYIMGIFTK